jgi:hypothetical protein
MNQELSTAKYVDLFDTPVPPPPGAPVPVKAATSGFRFESFARQASVFVGVMVVVCGAATLWMSRRDLADGARSARQRTSNPVDLVLWMGGSDKSIEDVIVQVQEDQVRQWEAISQNSEFGGIDFENLPDVSNSSMVPTFDPGE